MRKKYQDGIYATSCIGTSDQLLFRKGEYEGKMYALYIKDGEILGRKDWNEVLREMYTAPCLKLKMVENKLCFANN